MAEVPLADPEYAGFSSERLSRIERFAQSRVEEGAMAGLIVLVARKGQVVHFSATGLADTSAQRPLKKNAIFRFYSMTKPIAAVAMMQLFEEGRFQLDDPVSKYLPEFKNIRALPPAEAVGGSPVRASREPTIQDLFRHTAGFGITDAVGADLLRLNLTVEEKSKRLAALGLRYQPGSRFEYGMSTDVQVRIVEVLTGEPFDVYLKKSLLRPLGMWSTGYRVEQKDADRLVAVHWLKNGKLVPLDDKNHPQTGSALDDPREVNGYMKEQPYKGGNYGLVGTTEDYWRFAQMVANYGTFQGKRYLSPVTVRYIGRNHLDASTVREGGELRGMDWGLGFARVGDSVAAATPIPEGSLWWGGAAGTCFWIDFENDVVVVIMSQHLEAPGASWAAVRDPIAAIVYGALEPSPDYSRTHKNSLIASDPAPPSRDVVR